MTTPPAALVRTSTVPALFTAVVSLGVLARWFTAMANLGYLGWDTYPILATSRVASWADLGTLLTGRLMPDFYPGVFYRPLSSLTVAAELAVGGPNAAVSAGVQVGLLLLCALFFYRLQRKLMPTAPWVAATGTLLLLLHPAVGLVLPYLARRPDLLSTLFLVWMLDVEVGSAAPSWRRQFAGALLALAAMASKEIGLVAPLLVGGWALTAAKGDWRSRLVTGARRAAAPGAVALGYLLLRGAVLGGVGGHKQVGNPVLLLGHFRQLVGGLLTPRAPSPTQWILFGLAVTSAAVLLARTARRTSATQEGGWGATIVLGTIWLATLALVLTAAGRFSPWYVFAGIAPFCLIVAALLGFGARSVRESGAGRWLAVTSLAAGLMVTAVALDTSPALTPNPEWERASAEASAFLAGVEPHLHEASPGDLIKAGRFPSVVRPSDQALRNRAVAVLAPYSIRAWASMKRPELQIRVARPRQLRERSAQPGELTIGLRQRVKLRVGDGRELSLWGPVTREPSEAQFR